MLRTRKAKYGFDAGGRYRVPRPARKPGGLNTKTPQIANVIPLTLLACEHASGLPPPTTIQNQRLIIDCVKSKPARPS